MKKHTPRNTRYNWFLRGRQKGFTLIETLVAILVLTLAVAAAMTIAQKALQAAEYSRDDTTAYYLAAEELELIRNFRDNNYASDNNDPNSAKWLGGFEQCQTGLACEIEPNFSSDLGSTYNINIFYPSDETVVFTSVPWLNRQDACQLYMNSSGEYSCLGPSDGFTTATKFYRWFVMTQSQIDSSSVQYQITANVTWQSGLTTNTVSLEGYLLDWGIPTDSGS